MHKKLAADLTSLAHRILQMKNKEDVFALKEKAHEIYEKLALLAYVEEYINTTPNAEVSKEELIATIEEATEVKKEVTEEEKVVHQLEEEVVVETEVQEEVDEEEEMEDVAEVIAEQVIEGIAEEEIEQPFEELESLLFAEPQEDVKNDARDIGDKKTPTLEEELKDTIAVDVAADMFEKVTPQKSLNDALQKSIQIGLNDRIAFVKHLFDGDQGDYNRVISQLNTFKTEKEAKKFVNKMVKPDYDWSEKEEYEHRLLEIIERRFA